LGVGGIRSFWCEVEVKSRRREWSRYSRLYGAVNPGDVIGEGRKVSVEHVYLYRRQARLYRVLKVDGVYSLT
jgi:hypothetical protein